MFKGSMIVLLALGLIGAAPPRRGLSDEEMKKRMDALNASPATRPANEIIQVRRGPMVKVWVAKEDAPAAIKAWVEQFDYLRAKEIERIEKEMLKEEQAITSMKANPVKVKRGLVVQSEADPGIPPREKRLQQLRAELGKARNPDFPPPPPTLYPYAAVTVGRFGSVEKEMEVFRIVDKHTAILHVRWGASPKNAWVEGLDTSKVKAGKPGRIEGCFLHVAMRPESEYDPKNLIPHIQFIDPMKHIEQVRRPANP